MLKINGLFLVQTFLKLNVQKQTKQTENKINNTKCTHSIGHIEVLGGNKTMYTSEKEKILWRVNKTGLIVARIFYGFTN